jgi:hypothetical protein
MINYKKRRSILASEYTHRLNKIESFKEIQNDILVETEHYEYLFEERYQASLKNLLSQILFDIDKEDVFQLGIYLKSIGVRQFLEVLKEELSKIDEKQSFLKDFDLEENKKESLRLESEIEFLISKKEVLRKDFDSYPIKIRKTLEKIFENDLEINDQLIINDIKENISWKYSLNKKKREVVKAIKKYESIREESVLLTDGFDFHLEYESYNCLEKEIDEVSSKILKLKNDLKSLKQEKKIYEEDIKEIKRLDNFEKIKSKSIKSFVEFSLKINNINYYIEKILTKHNDTENLKTLVMSELHDQYFKNYLEYFKKIEKDIDKEIKFLEQELKYIAFTKMDKIESPYISNIGYFENRLLGYKKLKTMFYSFFSNKKIIKTDVFEEFDEKNKEIFKDTMLGEFFAEKSAFKIFKEKEKNKVLKEVDFILKKNNKEK